MVDTSYNPSFAPYAKWATPQAPVPATTHNLPSSIAGSSSVQSSLIVTEGFSLISAGVTASQAGTMSIQRYLDAGGTVVQGAASQVSLTANTAANLDVLDGKPFASFILTITNSSGSTSNLTNFALVLQASTASSTSSGGASSHVVVVDPTTGNGALVQAFHNADNQALGATAYGIMTGGVDQLLNGSGNLDRKRGVSGDGMAITGLAAEVPMLWNGSTYDRLPGSAATGARVYIGSTASDGSTTITTGGTAQNLFSGATPTNGFAIYNPDPSNDLWVSDSTTAAVNGQGSVRVVANGGGYETPPGYKPVGAVSIIGSTTSQKITARKW